MDSNTPRPGSTRLFTALIDGQPAELDAARDLLMLARSQGTLTETERSEPKAATIGKAVATRLHKDLFRLGYTRNGAHYQLATEVLARPVASLAGLSAEDAAQVWSYGCAQMGCATLPSIVYGLVA